MSYNTPINTFILLGLLVIGFMLFIAWGSAKTDCTYYTNTIVDIKVSTTSSSSLFSSTTYHNTLITMTDGEVINVPRKINHIYLNKSINIEKCKERLGDIYIYDIKP